MPRARRRVLLWSALFLLLLVALSLLVMLTVRHEAGRAQDQVDTLAAEAASQVRSALLGAQQHLQELGAQAPQAERWRAVAAELLQQQGAMLRIERRDADWRMTAHVDAPSSPPLFAALARRELDAAAACTAARRISSPVFSSSYFVPLSVGAGLEVIDLCLPLQAGTRDEGFLVATLSLQALLAHSLPAE